MNLILWIIIGLLVFAITIVIAFLASDNKDDSTPDKNEPSPIPTQINNEPILSMHARERMEQRLGISSSQQAEMMKRAFKYGKTSSRTTGDLKAKLESTENKYEESTVAKFYNGAIFIFSKEDNVLKTVYKYDPNKYLN